MTGRLPEDVERALDLAEMIRGTSMRPPPGTDPNAKIDLEAVLDDWLERTRAMREELDRLTR